MDTTLVSAASPADAKLILSRRGVEVLSVEQARSSVGWRRRSFDVAAWCRELRVLLVAGMTVVEAAEAMAAQAVESSRRAILNDLLARLHAGHPLSTAMSATDAYPSVLLAGITASERTSSVVSALDDFLNYHGMVDRLRRQATSAAIYPAMVLTVGVLVIVFLLLFVVPRFAALYADRPGTMSSVTTALIAVGRSAGKHPEWLAMSTAASVALLVWVWRTGRLERLADYATEHVTWIRAWFDEFKLAKLYKSLALLIRGGYTLDEAMLRCAQLGLGERLSGAVEQARQELVRGKHVSHAFSLAGISEPTASRLLAVAERTGNFDHVLETIAARHGERFSATMERVTRILEPALLLGVAVLVGTIVVLMYMPIFDLVGAVR